MNYKDFNELDLHDFTNIDYYISCLYNVRPITKEDDYIWVQNRIRHILEIIEKEEHDDNYLTTPVLSKKWLRGQKN